MSVWVEVRKTAVTPNRAQSLFKICSLGNDCDWLIVAKKCLTSQGKLQKDAEKEQEKVVRKRMTKTRSTNVTSKDTTSAPKQTCNYPS